MRSAKLSSDVMEAQITTTNLYTDLPDLKCLEFDRAKGVITEGYNAIKV